VSSLLPFSVILTPLQALPSLAAATAGGAAYVTMTDVNLPAVQNAKLNLDLNRQGGGPGGDGIVLDWDGTVRVSDRNLYPKNAIGSHACSLEVNRRVTNGILSGGHFLPVHTVHRLNTQGILGDESAETPLPTGIEPTEVVLGADIVYSIEVSVAVARSIARLLAPDGVAYIASATGNWRFGVDEFPASLEAAGLTVSTARCPGVLLWVVICRSSHAIGCSACWLEVSICMHEPKRPGRVSIL
jgi:hypothetical protein